MEAHPLRRARVHRRPRVQGNVQVGVVRYPQAVMSARAQATEATTELHGANRFSGGVHIGQPQTCDPLQPSCVQEFAHPCRIDTSLHELSPGERTGVDHDPRLARAGWAPPGSSHACGQPGLDPNPYLSVQIFAGIEDVDAQIVVRRPPGPSTSGRACNLNCEPDTAGIPARGAVATADRARAKLPRDRPRAPDHTAQRPFELGSYRSHR